MFNDDHCERTVQKIGDYLDGALSAEDVSDWALDVIVKTKDLDELDVNVLGAIQCLLDLNDKGESWCPGREELEEWKMKLESLMMQEANK